MDADRRGPPSLYPQIGDRRLVDYDLTMVFAGLSRMPYVRTLRRSYYRRPGRPRINNPRLWAVWFELLGSHVIYRRRFHFGVKTLGGYIFYAWLPDLAEAWPTIFAPAPPPPPPPPLRVEVIGLPEIKMAASQPETSNPPRELTGKEWITLEAQRLKRLNKIPAGISQTKFAKMLATNMIEAAKTDHSISIRPVRWEYIRNHLREWALWPIAIIE